MSAGSCGASGRVRMAGASVMSLLSVCSLLGRSRSSRLPSDWVSRLLCSRSAIVAIAQARHQRRTVCGACGRHCPDMFKVDRCEEVM